MFGFEVKSVDIAYRPHPIYFSWKMDSIKFVALIFNLFLYIPGSCNPVIKSGLQPINFFFQYQCWKMDSIKFVALIFNLFLYIPGSCNPVIKSGLQPINFFFQYQSGFENYGPFLIRLLLKNFRYFLYLAVVGSSSMLVG